MKQTFINRDNECPIPGQVFFQNRAPRMCPIVSPVYMYVCIYLCEYDRENIIINNINGENLHASLYGQRSIRENVVGTSFHIRVQTTKENCARGKRHFRCTKIYPVLI